MAPLLVFIQVLQDMVPPKKHLLRHQPANAQIGLMEGNTFCTTLQPRLFTMDLNVVEHKVFYTEVWCERVRLMADCQPVLERRQLSEKAWAAAEMPSCSLAQHLQRVGRSWDPRRLGAQRYQSSVALIWISIYSLHSNLILSI